MKGLKILLLVCFVHFHDFTSAEKDGYPIAAAWFRDRFTLEEWNSTLDKFGAIGGNKVFLRAPEFTIRTRDEILKDPQFQWCHGENSPSTHCVDEAEQLAFTLGLNITAWATYQYEEDFSDQIITCAAMDAKISSSRIYYRLMLPVEDMKVTTCPYPKETNVVVLLTSFAGIDPHHLLLQSAAEHNMSVFFSVPRAPKMLGQSSYISAQNIFAYYNFVERILLDHQKRFSLTGEDHSKTTLFPTKNEKDMRPKPYRRLFHKRGLDINVMYDDIRHYQTDQKKHNSTRLFFESLTQGVPTGKKATAKSLYDTIAGYYSPDNACLALLTLPGPGPGIQLPAGVVPHLDLYSNLGSRIHVYKKKFAVSPSIELLKSPTQSLSIEQHVSGLNDLANTKSIDIIAVLEGRGSGTGAYYFEAQANKSIVSLDPILDKILRTRNPKVPVNTTFADQYTGSVKELFQALNIARGNYTKTPGAFPFDLWMVIEAYENLRDDPCLPVDKDGSGMDVMLDKTTKTRVDWALSFGSVYVQEVAAFAWDPGFTCHTKTKPGYLAAQIYDDVDRPIIADCRWHSSFNMSIVVIGYNLLELQQNYEIHYRADDHTPRNATAFGYYFETDYGIANNLVPNLIYTQLFDLPDIFHIAPHGTITVIGKGSHHICMFTY